MRVLLTIFLGSTFLLPSLALSQDRGDVLQQWLAASPESQARMLKQIQSAPSIDIMKVARSMSRANPVQKNGLLGIAQSILAKDPKTSVPQLGAILSDPQLDPSIRYWAFTKITSANPEKRLDMLKGMLEDPSLAIRYEAIAEALKEAKGAKEAGAQDPILRDSYQKLLMAARLPEQINEIADSLKKLNVEVDLQKHMGFIPNWKLIGPFDNRGQSGFNVEYAPETQYAQNQGMCPACDGKSGKVDWQAATTTEKDGAVDLNAPFNKEKGAVVYAFTEVLSEDAVECEVRLGCINANKVWVNGKLAATNEVYHTGMQVDQYTAPVSLLKGKNTILVKVCQNEQTEAWAQDWKFQLRFTDASGAAIRLALK